MRGQGEGRSRVWEGPCAGAAPLFPAGLPPLRRLSTSSPLHRPLSPVAVAPDGGGPRQARKLLGDRQAPGGRGLGNVMLLDFCDSSLLVFVFVFVFVFVVFCASLLFSNFIILHVLSYARPYPVLSIPYPPFVCLSVGCQESAPRTCASPPRDRCSRCAYRSRAPPRQHASSTHQPACGLRRCCRPVGLRHRCWRPAGCSALQAPPRPQSW